MKKVFLFIVMVFLGQTMFAQLIKAGSEWKYFDNGSNQETAWRELNYNDIGWLSGKAQLGYGDGDETTVLSYGGNPRNKYITYYFRKKITVQNLSQQTGLQLDILRDDGAIVYINNTEVVRSNMPDGQITYTTLAAHTVSGSAENEFFSYNFPSSCLVKGENIVAVEIHQRSKTSSDISFDLKLNFTNLNHFRKGPYLLYSGNNNEMLILWQLNETGTCHFEWGTNTTYTLGSTTSNEYNNNHQYKINLSNLKTGTKYYYRITYKGSVKTGTFYTGVPDDQTRFSFYVYGDTRTCPQHHNLVARRIMTSIQKDPKSQTFVISTGDLVSNGDNESDWDDQFFSPGYKDIQNMLVNLPYITAMGNHAGTGKLFAKYFPYTMYQNSSYYFSFDYGNAHFTVIDQLTSYLPGSQQYTWLENDLATTDKPWKFVILHKPGWSADNGHANDMLVQKYIQPLCKQYGIYFVFTGHNHYYAHAVVDGVNHITTGGGGAPLYNPNPYADNIVKVDKSYHFCKVDIKNDTLTFTAIRYDGSVIETFDFLNPTMGIDNKSGEKKSFNVNITAKDHLLIVVNNETQKLELRVYDLSGKFETLNSF